MTLSILRYRLVWRVTVFAVLGVAITACSGAGPSRAASPPRLAWAPPPLDHPQVIRVTTESPKVVLDRTRDYILDLGDRPIRRGVRITGGHNVVLIGGWIDIPWDLGRTGVGLSIRRQAAGGTVHVEGLRFSGAVHDAINIEQPEDTTIQIENVFVDGLHATDEVHWSDSHPDLIQTWTGPDVLRIDRLTGYTPLQGLFFEPDDDLYHGPGRHNIPSFADVRNVNIRRREDVTEVGSRLLWQSTPFPMAVENVWIDPGYDPPERSCWPSCAVWQDVRFGVPSEGDIVRRGEVGLGYRSPGYLPSPVRRSR
jgi:hypothetical protein